MIVRPRHQNSTPPLPSADPDPNGGDATTPKGLISASYLWRGASNLSPTLLGILAVPLLVVVVSAIVIVVIVDVTPTLTLSLCVGHPIMRGPVDIDVAAGVAVAELFDFQSVPRQGHRQEWLLLPPHPNFGGKDQQQQ
jgi:hypothetical protein